VPARVRALLPDDRFLAEPLDERFRDALARVLGFRVAALRFRVAAAFRAEADRADFGRDADMRPPIRPPFRAGALFVFFPRPAPLFRPPPDISFSVAHARRSASFRGTPRATYPSSMCSACRFCFSV
jgi:hypothetical protein